VFIQTALGSLFFVLLLIDLPNALVHLLVFLNLDRRHRLRTLVRPNDFLALLLQNLLKKRGRSE
jgi:hypothetical protein